uniref:Conserved hypothetical plastid protein n=1 Tax=Corallina ferreyrae TaxID=2547422 RepID=A0A482CFT1_9FLOR|nr:conserved hypothetical plastid protein [Corallina ferreyrae]QBL75716.1 conserved hypothetical plastid protein [Corallina ferreyrae]
MNRTLLINRMSGNWVIQSTTYSLVKKNIKTLINEVEWSPIYDKLQNLKYIRNHISKKTDAITEVYILEKKIQNIQEKILHIFLFNKKSNGYIVKLDDHFQILSQSTFKYYSNNVIFINQKLKNHKITEKIYFLNDNLKIVKSVFYKNNNCIGICFSSEIKIS